MNPINILGITAALVVGIPLFYLMGKLLGKHWWYIAVFLGLLLLASVICIEIVSGTPTPQCESYTVVCLPDNFLFFTIGIIGSYVSVGCAVIGLPAAYMGARKKASQNLHKNYS